MYEDQFNHEAAQRLKQDRWTLLSGMGEHLPEGTRGERLRLIEEARLAPLDPFCPERFRRRYYHKGYVVGGQFLRDASRFDPAIGHECVPFDQGHANPEFAGKVRMMPAIPERLFSNRVYRSLHERCLAIAREARDFAPIVPMAWESHIIRLEATPDKPAVATPDLVHYDDDQDRMITFIIVAERENVVGGINIIAARHCAGRPSTSLSGPELYYEGTIETPFDGYGFIDSDVSHYVSGIHSASGAASGTRTILIFDFVRMIREPIALAA